MNVLQCGASVDRRKWRSQLQNGDIIIIDPTPAALKLAALARDIAWEVFAPLDPEDAHRSIGPDACAVLAEKVKARFARHPEAIRLVRKTLAEVGCETDSLLVDGPRMHATNASATGSDETSATAARDTWGGAPSAQANWWMPVFEMNGDNGIVFFPETWGRNDVQSLGASFKPVVRPGALVVYSAARLCAPAPGSNGRTRFGISFRAVDIRDLEADGRDVKEISARPPYSSFDELEAIN